MAEEVMQAPPKKKVSRDRMKISAKCGTCRKRMFRGENNRATCSKHGVVPTVGPVQTEKATVTTVPKRSAKGKE